MKATSLLEKQHRKVESLFRKLEAEESEAPTLFRELANDLAAHMAIEQNIFYPAVREVNPDLIAESFEEHAVAEIALKRLLAIKAEDPTFTAKVTILKELILHHVAEEEEELFPAVEKTLGDERIEALGKEMKAAFEVAVQQGYKALMPKGFAKTSADESNVVAGKRSAKRAPADGATATR